MSSGSELLFGPESDEPTETQEQPTIHSPKSDDGHEYLILVVDDDEYVHQLTNMVLKGFTFDGSRIRLESAMSATQARAFLDQRQDVAVILLDVVMETDDAGLRLVNHIRNELSNNEVRLLIRTGQPGAAPEESVFHDYDINDYLSKTDLTAHKLRMAMLNALRSYRDIRHAAELQKQIMMVEQESKAAEAASQAKSQFLAHMSHEIRTPLNGIIGIADILAGTPLTDEQSQYLQTIRGSGEALLSIINDILDFSKIEAGKLELENTNFQMIEVCETLSGLFLAQLRNKNLEFKFTIDKDIPPYILGDPLRLKQILLNLIGNSIKFTHEGGVYLNVSIASKEGNDFVLEFEIRDTGIGIPVDKQKQLFEAFTQADSSTTRKYGGTGLGLQISKRLVELMGGKIKLTSEEGQGSTFSFTVAAAKGEMNNDSDYQASHSTSQPASNVRILVAEDNVTNQLVVKAMLKKLGYQFDITNNGAEAIDALHNGQFDIVLMDCQMPVLDGFGATRKIRSEKAFEDLPVIALTAGATAKEQKQCFEAGMTDFLSKPITIQALHNTLKKWH